MTDQPEQGSKYRLPWVRIVLFTSLALNLLIAGAFVGARFSERGPEGKPASVRDQIAGIVGPYGRALSQEDRRALGRSFVRNARELRGTRQEMRALGRQVVEALRAEPFDPASVRALLDQQIALSQGLQTKGRTLLVEQIEAMTPQARIAFADRLEAMLKRGPRRPRGE